MAPKNHLPTAASRTSAVPPTKPSNGLWLDISPPLVSPHPGAALGPHGSQGLWLAPGQTQTLQAQGSRRYRLGLRDKPAPTEPLPPMDQPLLVLRHGEDLWLSNAQAASLVLNGFFADPDNHLEIELGDQSWRLDGLATGQPMAGSDAQLMYWHGQAAPWPDALSVTTAEGGFELHKTQWQGPPVPATAAQAAASSAATATTAEAASATSATSAATSSAATLTSAEAAASSAAAEAASAASAATSQAAGTAAATGAAAPTAAGAAAVSAAGTGTAAAAASAAMGVGMSGAAVGAAALGLGAIAAASSGKKADSVVATPSTSTSTNTIANANANANTNTNTNTNTVTNKAPTAVALTSALTNNAIAENTSC